jgi:hypothetical protein
MFSPGIPLAVPVKVVWNCLARGRMAPTAGFKLAAFRLTAEAGKNLSALSGVAYEKSGAILIFLAAPNPALKTG